MRLFVLMLGLIGVSSVLVAEGLSDEKTDALFENQIRPVLVETCFSCHGGTKISGGFRVDSREGLLKGGDSGTAIAPGMPQSSLLIKAIKRHDDVSPMPPGKDKGLRPEQVAHFEKWILEGADWPANDRKFESKTHWAFEPISAIDPAPTQNHRAVAIDDRIRDQQESAGVAPNYRADKVTLIRRATFDLTGLPPTLDEVSKFEKDQSPTAFGTLIDRLLDSPEYGERWGRHWLDIVRYADTAGETADYPVTLAWRYRNYVIDAFNSDKPYDQFLQEQIAGDILAEQSGSDRYAALVTATGYLAISRRFGFDSENYHHLTIQDTIDNLGQTFMGLSLGCARCHDHKFDAVTMRDYYGLYAIFDSSRYAFPGSEQKQKTRTMAPLIPAADALPKWRAFEKRIALLSRSLEKRKQPVPTAILRSLCDMDGDFETQAPAAGGSNGVLVPPWQYEGKVAITNDAQSPFKNLYMGGKVGVNIAAGAGEYRIAQTIYLRRDSNASHSVDMNLDFRIDTESNVGGSHRFWIGPPDGAAPFIVSIQSNTLSVLNGEETQQLGTIIPKEWHNLQLQLDISRRVLSSRLTTRSGMQSFDNFPLNPNWSGALEQIVLKSFKVDVEELPTIEFDNIGVQEDAIPPATQQFQSVATETSLLDEAETLADRNELNRLLVEGPFEMAYGMSEGTAHDVRIHLRGEPSQPGEMVPRGFIQAMKGNSLPTSTRGSGRLELARWLTSPENPTTARVMVNRIWQYHFGRGLVKTPNDFGVRGIPPTHPELLDELAHQFMQSGWSIKSIHRAIMLSDTYQQSSVVRPASKTSKATLNVSDIDVRDLYIHFSRRRLSAEEIRDSILMVSGELDRNPGKEHPFPSPITWGYTQHGPFTAVYDHNKRSIYLMTQRLKRHPFLTLFDGADPNATTADRIGTTVPTQALYFLNDPFIHAKSEAWARRLRDSIPTTGECVEHAYRTAYARTASSEELQDAKTFIANYEMELVKSSKANLQTGSLAAFLRTLFASNEFLTLD